MSQRRKRISDPELLAIGEAVTALESLSPEQRERLASYLFRRYVPDRREGPAKVSLDYRPTMPLFSEAEGEGSPQNAGGD